MTKEEEITFIESELQIQVPSSYRNVLLSKGNVIAFGLPLLGLPATYELSTALGATSLLRTIRPELKLFLAIRIIDDRVLCLDLTQGNKTAAPLVEVNISLSEQPTVVRNSFNTYLNESEQSRKQVEYGLRRIENVFSNKLVKPNTHTENEGRVPFKARDWRIHRCCVHDLVVGKRCIQI